MVRNTRNRARHGTTSISRPRGFRPRLEPLESRTLLDAGDLDLTFGDQGIVRTDFQNGSEQANAIAIQADGRILAAGFSDQDVALARYEPDGSPDLTFGTVGRLMLPASAGPASALALVLQPDGRILTGGTTYVRKTGQDFGLTRHLTNGEVDKTWGDHGRVSTDLGGATDYAFGIALQKNGMVVAVGEGSQAGSPRFALARYQSNGELDATFGVKGRILSEFPARVGSARGVVVQDDDRIVVAGETGPVGAREFAVARYNADGTPDKTFGQRGQVTTRFGTGDHFARALAVQADGKIVVAGGSAGDFALARYRVNGSLDTSFGVGGLVTTDIVARSTDVIMSIALQADGKIVAVGRYAFLGGYTHFALARYHPDGTLDDTFGNAGRVTTVLGSQHDFAQSVALQPSDGKIVVAGSTSEGPPSTINFALARYEVEKGNDRRPLDKSRGRQPNAATQSLPLWGIEEPRAEKTREWLFAITEGPNRLTTETEWLPDSSVREVARLIDSAAASEEERLVKVDLGTFLETDFNLFA